MILARCHLSSGMELKIREAVLSDAQVLTDFNVRLAEESEGLGLDAALVEAGVAAVLKDQAKGTYYVAEVAGAVAGQLMITYEWSDWRNGNMWWIQSVYREAGIPARRNIPRALPPPANPGPVTPKDVCSLRLYVHADNTRASQSYERLGMTRTHYEIFELDVRREDGQ